MKKKEIYTGYVERVDFPNKGIVRAEDETVNVKGVLPGQTVEFITSKKKNNHWEGRLKTVLTPADYELSTRDARVCPNSGVCGGCTYQTMPYEMQLELKKNQVKRIIDSVCKDEYEFEGILPSPLTEGYRNKMEFSFGDEFRDGPLALGMHKKGSFYDIVTASCCRIVHDDFRKILSSVLEFWAQRDAKFFHKMTHEGYLRHLLVRRGVSSGEVTVNLVTSTQRDAAKIAEEDVAFKEMLLALPLEGKIVGISHIYNDSLADVVQSDRTDILYGRDYFYEELLGLKFKISTFSFFQTNSLGAEVLYSKAREYVGDTKDKTIFDLYSGTGTIAQILAPVAKKVVGVEIVEEAVEAAKVNASENGLSNCEFIAGDVLKVIDDITDKPDFIVLDPPRDGIHPKALQKIIDFGVDRMVYISCKPTSLARDLVTLQERGYKVEKVCVCDMFVATANVETVCLLSKRD